MAHTSSTSGSVWELGDYHRFATTLIWGLGQRLVDAAGITPGQRVLDVATGSGNTALRAAAAGAEVVACDLTPAGFEAGRREAEQRALDLAWVRADAEELPFPEASFDAVLSSVGAMWAPHHQRVADEMLRVCRPGGLIAMLNFDAAGLIGDFLDVFADVAPAPPPDALPPPLWGDEAHVRALLGGRVEGFDFSRGSYVERVPGGPRGFCDFYRETFGPVRAIYESLADRPSELAHLDERFLAFARAANRGLGSDAELRFGYALVLARVR